MILSIIRLILRFFFKCAYKVKITGTENVPLTGGVMITPNHTSNWDPPFIGSFAPRRVRFMAKSGLFKGKLGDAFFRMLGAFPVERGMADVEAIKTSIRLLKSGEAVILFPHGKRIKQGEDLPIKDGAVMIALRSGVPIVPVYISGNYKFRTTMKITFGKPIDYSEYHGQKLPSEKQKALSAELWSKIKELNN